MALRDKIRGHKVSSDKGSKIQSPGEQTLNALGQKRCVSVWDNKNMC